jgi:peptide/nickel transport system ATP-binding protein
MKSTLTVDKLTVYYFSEREIVKAVDGVRLELNHNCCIGLAGESGCGKSTLGTALLRSVQPPGKVMAGSVTLDGTDIFSISISDFDKKIRWKKIAMIFQGAMNSLNPVFTVGKQMNEILEEHKFSGNTSACIKAALEQVLLDESIIKKYPHELSGGQKQRIIIAMALLLKPQILIADEPTTSLDVLVQAQIINLLKSLKKQYGLSILFISHDLGVISELADSVAIMYAGQIVEFGASRLIYSSPRHPYTQRLIAAVPRMKDERQNLESLKGKPPDLAALHEGCRFADRCPLVMDICKLNPPLTEIEGASVRCWLYKKK